MRGLFFDHADDPEIWEHPHQFMLGRGLLVSPVIEPGAGTWATKPHHAVHQDPRVFGDRVQLSQYADGCTANGLHYADGAHGAGTRCDSGAVPPL